MFLIVSFLLLTVRGSVVDHLFLDLIGDEGRCYLPVEGIWVCLCPVPAGGCISIQLQKEIFSFLFFSGPHREWETERASFCSVFIPRTEILTDFTYGPLQASLPCWVLGSHICTCTSLPFVFSLFLFMLILPRRYFIPLDF